MKPASAMALTMAIIGGLAGWAIHEQRQELRILRAGAADPRPMGATGAGDVRPVTVPVERAADSPMPEAPSGVDGAPLVERMIDALTEKQPALEAAADATASAIWAERLETLLRLPAGTANGLRSDFQRLIGQARAIVGTPGLDDAARRPLLDDLEGQLLASLQEVIGEANTAVYRAAERARRESSVEHQAALAVHAVSEIVDLQPAQMDALYSAFAEKARERSSVFQPGEMKPQFSFAWEEGPRVSDPMPAVRAVLSTEQMALYEKTLATERRARQQELQTAVQVMREVAKKAMGMPAVKKGSG